jgi:hypothetical protein
VPSTAVASAPPVDPDKSYASADDFATAATLHVARSFTIFACGADGARVTRGGAVVTADVIGPKGDEARAAVVDEGNGTYTVVHTFEAEGEFEVRPLRLESGARFWPMCPPFRLTAQ